METVIYLTNGMMNKSTFFSLTVSPIMGQLQDETGILLSLNTWTWRKEKQQEGFKPALPDRSVEVEVFGPELQLGGCW